MSPKRSLRAALKIHWLSWTLVVMAYATYGGFLHHHQAIALVWGVSAVVAVWGAWAITLGWPHIRRLILLGFQSDVGYCLMALIAASLAVAAVTRFQQFVYFVMLVAVSLLARVDNLIAGFRDSVAFVWLSALALLGLMLSWWPVLVGPSSL